MTPAVSSAPARDIFQHLRKIVVDSVNSPHSKYAYGRALDDFFAWWLALSLAAPMTKALLLSYKAFLASQKYAPASINLRLTALRKLVEEMADAQLIPLASAMHARRVKSVELKGVRVGNWLTAEQVRAILAAPDSSLRGKRDKAVLGTLIGCGLRRSELAALTYRHLAMREGRWVVLDIVGKGQRVRTVPIPPWAKDLIDVWTAVSLHAFPECPYVFRVVDKRGCVAGRPILEQTIVELVRRYGNRIGVPKLAPHDLRRTCAKLCKAGGGDLDQIQMLLGHASIQTTERYLGNRQNLKQAANDLIVF
jgi:integrase